MKMKVTFNWHDTIHPNSDNLSTVELAQILEDKYNIVENFSKYAEPLIDKKIVEWLLSGRRVITSRINNELQQMWREYARAGKLGVSKAAEDRGDPAFVDTSTYMLNMMPMVKFDKDLSNFIIDDSGSIK